MELDPASEFAALDGPVFTDPDDICIKIYNGSVRGSYIYIRYFNLRWATVWHLFDNLNRRHRQFPNFTSPKDFFFTGIPDLPRLHQRVLDDPSQSLWSAGFNGHGYYTLVLQAYLPSINGCPDSCFLPRPKDPLSDSEDEDSDESAATQAPVDPQDFSMYD